MTKQNVLDLAYSEEEYAEKAKKYLDKYGVSILYDQTNFSGNDNLTKYAYELSAAGIGHPNGYAWCQTFIAWLFWKCYGAETADKLLCGTLRSASTMVVKDAMLKGDRLVPLVKAAAGDIVFRSRSGGGHVGLVVGRASNGKIITVEGNTSPTDATSWNGGQVARHTGASWEWCVRPDYSILKDEEDKDPGWHWCSWGGDWYYQNKFGNNWHGWAKLKETAGDWFHWYWFNNRGIMVKGAVQIDDHWYFFLPEGDLEGALCITDTNGALNVWSMTE